MRRRVLKETEPETFAFNRKGKRAPGQGSVYRRDSGIWYITYRDAQGKRVERSAKTRDKATARRALDKAIAGKALIVEGVVDADEADFAAESRQPIKIHLDAYERHLRDRCSDRHVATAIARVRKIVEAGGIQRLGDLKPTAVERAMADLRRDRGFAEATANKHIVAIRAFGNWLLKQRRVPRHPLPHLDKLPVADTEHRRAMTVEEARWLLDATRTGEELRGLTRKGQGFARGDRDIPAAEIRWTLSGPARAILYTLTLEAGLRRGAIERLRVADFHLGDGPTVTIQAVAKTKAKKRQTIPLRRETADLLADHFNGRLPTTAAFDMPQGHETARMVRHDLEVARAAWIADGADADERAKRAECDTLAPEDAEGRKLDFHALRTTCATWLDAAGVSASLATRITGHASVTTLQRHYHRADMTATRGAVELLPDLRATGTDGPVGPHRPDEVPAKVPAKGVEFGGGVCSSVETLTTTAGVGSVSNVLKITGETAAGGQEGGLVGMTGLGLEPRTSGLKGRCSTVELPGQKLRFAGAVFANVGLRLRRGEPPAAPGACRSNTWTSAATLRVHAADRGEAGRSGPTVRGRPRGGSRTRSPPHSGRWHNRPDFPNEPVPTVATQFTRRPGFARSETLTPKQSERSDAKVTPP